MKEILTPRTQLLLIVALAIFALALFFSNWANPDNPLLFGLKRVQENIFLSLKSEKLDYMNGMLERRKQELVNLSTPQKSYFLWSSSLRYSTTAGRITEMIRSQNSRELAQKQINILNKDKEEFKPAWFGLPRNVDNQDWKFVEDAMNYIDIYTDQLKKI